MTTRTLGAEIRRLRLHHNGGAMRQEDLARAIGQQRATQVTKYENDSVTPDPATLEKLATALGVPVDHFAAFGGAYNARAPRRTAPIVKLPADDPVLLRLGGAMVYALSVKTAATVHTYPDCEDEVIDTFENHLNRIRRERKA